MKIKDKEKRKEYHKKYYEEHKELDVSVKKRIPANKKIISKKRLIYLYTLKHLSPLKISKILNCSDVTIRTRLKDYGIKFKPYKRSCLICKGEFLIKSNNSEDKKVCSKKCSDKDYYLRVRVPEEVIGQQEKRCLFCNKKFITLPGHPYQIYCSRYCAHKIQTIKNPEYFKKYKKEYYQKHKDNLIKRSKQWTINNPERYKARNKIYYAKNREKVIKKVHEWYENYKIRENKRRKKLRLPLIGEGFTNEMELLIYVHNLFQDYEILTHHRKTLGDWGLQGLELDIYIPELKLAFEYMGKQHYDEKTYYLLTSYNKIKKDFEYQLYKDKCKKRLCKLKGITLIRIKYDEKLSEQLVLSKLKYTSINTNQEVLTWI